MHHTACLQMSDFASLLGKLQDTAKTAQEATANPKKRRVRHVQEDQEQQNSKRRQRTERKVVRPRDIHDLKVKISFLCIGAQKAGTTWLHEMLNRHPNLALPEQKEIHFWDWYVKTEGFLFVLIYAQCLLCICFSHDVY